MNPRPSIALALSLLALSACAAPTGEEATQATSELSFGGGAKWTVFKLPTGPNPAARIRGPVRGVLSPELRHSALFLDVEGLPPNRAFGAHLHAKACADGSGGGHYQHVGTTVSKENEVWLDFETNSAGRARVVARRPYGVDPARAKSVVVHANETDPATGKAGDKLACVDLTFEEPGATLTPVAPPTGGSGSCQVSYQCTNGACACSAGAKAGKTCADPLDCERQCREGTCG